MSLQQFRIKPIVQLWKLSYRKSKHETGQQFAAMNFFFFLRKLMNITTNLRDSAYKASALFFLLAEVRMHQTFWCLDLLISCCMAYV